MINFFLITLGKSILALSRSLNLGHGSTWPGHIALSINKNFINELVKANPQLKIILIAGTNGKTTTGKLIQTILENNGKKVFQNEAGANLLNGIASTIIQHSNIVTEINYDFAIFEIDENTLPLILKEITPDYLILLNLFRDQLDRYGEVNTIANKWGDAIRHLLPKTKLILNADDPQIAHLGVGGRHSGKRSSALQNERIQNLHGAERLWTSQRDGNEILYFGLNDKKLAQTIHQHAADSTYCPHCGSKLYYKIVYYSHLGDWECKKCGNKRPKNIFSNPPPSRLSGSYNLYNILAAVLVANNIGVTNKLINDSLKTFIPAFGRQEILKVDGKKFQIFLSKNPTSFNESLRTIKSLGGKNVLFVLNDRIPDGRDVSWIWDVDFEDYFNDFKNIIVSGDRCYDMGLRIKYSGQKLKGKSQNHNSKVKIYEKLDDAVRNGLSNLKDNQTLYILPTYSAMLEVRKILTGKKIL